jgi:hypothetical protein
LVVVAICGFLVLELYRLRREETSVRPGAASSTAKDCLPYSPLPLRADAPRGLVDVTDRVRLDFSHVVGPLGTYFMPESIGAGGAFIDYDSDGRLDLYLVNCGKSPAAEGDFPPGTRSEDRLFRMTESGYYEDVTAEAGLGESGYGAGCAVGDVNNDGHPDVYVTNYGTDRLWLNNGDGAFLDATEAAGLVDADWGTCATFLDFDRDGWLDLFVVNYTADPQFGHSIACGFHFGLISYCGPHKFRATVDRLYRNDGIVAEKDGVSRVRFSDVTAEAGLTTGPTYGFGVVCADFTGDGWVDVYVASDGDCNRLWVNQRDGRFVDEAVARGAALNRNGLPEGSMGAAAGDVNNDGALDLLVTNLSQEKATLYINTGSGLFADVSAENGLLGPTRMHTGWGTALVDLDHDGGLDLPIVNGLVVPCHSRFPFHGEDKFIQRRDVVPDPAAFWRDYADRNVLLSGDGAGQFSDADVAGGDFCAADGSGRSLITGDFDNDGDLDLLVTNCGGRARLYRNDLPKRGDWLMVRAFDPARNRDAYGAEIVVRIGDRSIHRVAQPVSGYLASHDPRVHVGLGDAARYDEVLVRWPDGPVETAMEAFPGGPANRLIVLSRGTGRPVPESTE